jgi:hypothetical protein
LNYYPPTSFEAGCLHYIAADKFMEKDNHLALSRLMKSIEILRKEECSNPLILSENIKMLLD